MYRYSPCPASGSTTGAILAGAVDPARCQRGFAPGSRRWMVTRPSGRQIGAAPDLELIAAAAVIPGPALGAQDAHLGVAVLEQRTRVGFQRMVVDTVVGIIAGDRERHRRRECSRIDLEAEALSGRPGRRPRVLQRHDDHMVDRGPGDLRPPGPLRSGRFADHHVLGNLHEYVAGENDPGHAVAGDDGSSVAERRTPDQAGCPRACPISSPSVFGFVSVWIGAERSTLTVTPITFISPLDGAELGGLVDCERRDRLNWALDRSVGHDLRLCRCEGCDAQQSGSGLKRPASNLEDMILSSGEIRVAPGNLAGEML